MGLEPVDLPDGTRVVVMRGPGATEEQWRQLLFMLKEDPAKAREAAEITTNPFVARKAYCQELMVELFKKQYHDNKAGLDQVLKHLASDPQLSDTWDSIRRGGKDEATKVAENRTLMMKISSKIGGYSDKVKEMMKEIKENPVTYHEAAMMGDEKRTEEYLGQMVSLVDYPDYKGVTALGYAVACGRINIVRYLLKKKADPAKVDSKGNSSLHYAAGYGRKEVLEFLLGAGVDRKLENSDGQTASDVAALNKYQDLAELLNKN